MNLLLYNTLTKRKEIFTPRSPSVVTLYVCGPTVYDRAHMGNARSVVAFDVLYRLLRVLFRAVYYVRNITDVDDKINAAAREKGVPIREITQATLQWFHEDMAALYALPPRLEPRATDHIEEMVTLIQALIEKGHAYEKEGHVLFEVGTYPTYGRLSNRSMEEMLAGARVEVAPYKKHPSDFVLWKPSDASTPGWESPWGYGRPGWHIECSAMSSNYLDVPFDIHAGGCDLMFPHHENEIAQSASAFGCDYARFWLHNGFLTVNGEKMSKSLGNVITLDKVLLNTSGEVIRYLLLSAHYRSSLDWTQEGIINASRSLDRLYRSLMGVDLAILDESEVQWKKLSPIFQEAMLDDCNTPKALAELHHLAGVVRKDGETKAAEALWHGGRLLGLFNHPVNEWLQSSVGSESVEEEYITGEIQKRQMARQSKDFAEADRIRDRLQEQGIFLEDTPEGTIWRRER